MKNIDDLITGANENPRIPHKHKSNYASLVGSPCARQLYYYRVDGDKAEPMTPETIQKLSYYSELERITIRRMEDAGLKIVEQQAPVEWSELQISGRIEGKIEVEHNNRIPFEIKTISPHLWDKISRVEDFFLLQERAPWVARYVAQAMVYLVMSNAEEGRLILINRDNGKAKSILVHVVDDYMKELVEKFIKVNDAVKQQKLPEGIEYNELVCGMCPFKRICDVPANYKKSDKTVQGLDYEQLADLTERWHATKPFVEEYKVVDDQLKKLVNGHPHIVVGNTVITGKEVTSKYVDISSIPTEVKELYTKTRKSWRKKISKVETD